MFDVNDCWTKTVYQQFIKHTSFQLWRYIQNHAKELVPEQLFLNLTRCNKDDLRLLADIHFLLSDHCQKLIKETAPEILNRLKKTTINETKEVYGKIEGRVNWSKTIVTQHTNGRNPALFVCTRRSSLFDLPENQVLYYMIKEIAKATNRIASVEEILEEDRLNPANSKQWSSKLQSLASASSKLLKNPYMKEISDVHELTEPLIEKTERARGQYYKDLAETTRVYYECKNDPYSFLLKQLPGRVLEPLSKNTLYELAVLFTFINTAGECGWKEKSLRLIGAGCVSSVFVRGDATLKIYYQGNPDVFNQFSKYKEVIKKYGLSDRTRRPDIILEYKESDKLRYCIVEVKRSDKRQYLVDGIYKLFGYLKDYEDIKSTGAEFQGILVGYKGLSDCPPIPGHEIYACSWKNLKDSIKAVI
ncbi:hypothetical protein P9578_06830 [Brevibacillus choshinensis]|uniref:hypothetical protein n=1 Tax=Brevibacillus choshinensis TaxID=54911 RepID=UPI002E251D7C|nr:hypothetical protein [Brevibacillus choshinensis]